MLSSDVKILNVTGMKVWRWQFIRPTLNFMQLTPVPALFGTGSAIKLGYWLNLSYFALELNIRRQIVVVLIGILLGLTALRKSEISEGYLSRNLSTMSSYFLLRGSEWGHLYNTKHLIFWLGGTKQLNFRHFNTNRKIHCNRKF